MAEKEIYPVRFNEVTNLIAHMLGEDYDTVAQMVYNTDIGKALNLNREDILYEQVTDNVLSSLTTISTLPLGERYFLATSSIITKRRIVARKTPILTNINCPILLLFSPFFKI